MESVAAGSPQGEAGQKGDGGGAQEAESQAPWWRSVRPEPGPEVVRHPRNSIAAGKNVVKQL